MAKKIMMLSVRSDFGGGPEHMLQLLKELNKSKETFLFYVAAPTGEPYYKEFLKIVGASNFFLLPYRKFSFVTFFKLLSFIRKKDIDILHSHGKGAGIYSRLIKVFNPWIKVVHTFHGFHVGNYSAWQRNAYLLLESFLSLVTDKIINVSDGEQNTVLKSTFITKNKCVVIPNGVKNLDRTEIRKENPCIKICYLSRPEYQKNVEEILSIKNAIVDNGILDNFVIDIYGDVDEQLKRKFLLDKHFEMKGCIECVSSLFYSYDIFINTSRWEGMPLSIIEAMSSKTPVLASDVVGNNSLIKDGKNGYLYELYNVNDAALKIRDILTMKQETLLVIENAKTDVNNKYSVVKMSEDTQNVYCKLL